MAEYITKEQVIDWFRPYGHTDEPIPFEVLAADLRGCIPAAEVAPVRHGRWMQRQGGFWEVALCSECGNKCPTAGIIPNYCPNCGAKMDLVRSDGSYDTECADEKSCDTCRFNDLEPSSVGNPCWNCKGPNYPEWEHASVTDSYKNDRLRAETTERGELNGTRHERF